MGRKINLTKSMYTGRKIYVTKSMYTGRNASTAQVKHCNSEQLLTIHVVVFFGPTKKNMWCCAKMFNWSSLQCSGEGFRKGSDRWNLYLYFSLYLYFWDSETNPVFAKVVLQQGRVQPNGICICISMCLFWIQYWQRLQ